MEESWIFNRTGLEDLFQALSRRGYQVIGPTLDRGAICYAPLRSSTELPVGLIDEQDGGHYRVRPVDAADPDSRALFRYAAGYQGWKRYLYPPRQRLWQAQRQGEGWQIEREDSTPPRHALLGARPCELAALDIQDRVFDNGDFADPGYKSRRAAALVIALNCTRPGGTCFCTSMGTGPTAREGFDLCLTELVDAHRHVFLAKVGTPEGGEILAEVPHRPAKEEDIQAAQDLTGAAVAAMGRQMLPQARALLKRSLDHPRWQETAQRCLGCGNCTLVCPTCFCSTVEDHTSLDGRTAARWRLWDTCFSLDFSYIHGGAIRRGAAARYRQWITHKLSAWHDQFGSSGCVGCGRCITWCPVGIDITEEVAALRDFKPATVQEGA